MTDEDIQVSVWDYTGSQWAVVGSVTYKSLEFEPRHLDVGTLTMTVPMGRQADKLLEDRLLTTLFRGDLRTWTIEPNPAYGTDGPVVEVTGYDALHRLSWLAAYPSPAQPIDQQAATTNVTGPAETVIRQLVSDNFARYGVDAVVDPSAGTGATVLSNIRFDSLLTEVLRLAKLGGIGVRYGLVPSGDSTRADLTFSTYVPQDRSVRVLLSIADGSIGDWDLRRSPPTCTKAIVGGAGVGAGQYLRVVSTPDGDADAARWGGHREQYVDGPETFDNTQLDQAGEEAILAGRSTETLTMSAREPRGTKAFMAFGPGDTAPAIPYIRVEADGTLAGIEITDTITAINVHHETGFPEVTPKYGNPDAADADAMLAGHILALRLEQQAMKTNRKRGSV